MTIKASCPHCDTVHKVADMARGKKVRCTKCSEPFTVPGEARRAEPVDELMQPKGQSLLRPPPARVSSYGDDFDDERPRPRRQRPARERKSSGSAVALIAIFGALGLGVLILIAIGVWYRSAPADAPANGPALQDAVQAANAVQQNPAAAAANNAQAPNIPVTDKPIVLFNGKVGQDFPRPGLRFSVEYKFQNGAALPGQQYFWVIEPEQGDGYEVRINWLEMGKEDTLKASSFMPGFRTRGPYTMYIQVAQLGAGIGRRGRDTVSNKLVVNLPAQVATDPGIGGAPGANPGPGAPPGPPPRVERKPLDDAEITAVVGDLGSTDNFRILGACNKLTNALPEKRRDEVAKALEKPLANRDLFARQSAARALAVWGTKDSVPALIKAADDKEFAVRWAVLEALAPFKDARAAAKLAEHLVDHGDRIHAKKALEQIGSAAEKEVAKFVDHSDWAVRMDACKILSAIGTKESLPALRVAQQDSNGLVKRAADEAAAACARR